MFLKKLQSKPPHVKRAIFWIVIVVVGLIMGLWWIKTTTQRLSKLNRESILQESQMPKLELPPQNLFQQNLK